MTGFLSDGMTFLADTLDEQVGVSVVYQRGPITATLTAVTGQTTFESDNEFGVLKIESRDFLVTASRLSAFGEPQRGDRIVETQGSDTVTHEVLDQPGIPPFSYSDSSRQRLRIHTKRITTV